MSHTFQYGIRFALYGFLSLIITASRLISFPAGTKTFQFPAFPIVKTIVSKTGSPIQQSWVQRLRAPRPSIMQLATVFIGNPSQEIGRAHV